MSTLDPQGNADAVKNVKRATTIIYVGGVLFAEVMFLWYVSKAFESGFVALFASVGAVLVGMSSIVFLYAKDHWFSDGAHEMFGYGFWALDMIILALNTLVSFEVAGVIKPEHVPVLGDILSFWTILSPATPIIVVAMWAILRALSPEAGLQKSHIKQMSRIMKQHAKFLENEAINSQEAQDILKKAARQLTLDNAKAIAQANANAMSMTRATGTNVPQSPVHPSVKAEFMADDDSLPEFMANPTKGDNGQRPKA